MAKSDFCSPKFTKGGRGHRFGTIFFYPSFFILHTRVRLPFWFQCGRGQFPESAPNMHLRPSVWCSSNWIDLESICNSCDVFIKKLHIEVMIAKQFCSQLRILWRRILRFPTSKLPTWPRKSSKPPQLCFKSGT